MPPRTDPHKDLKTMRPPRVHIVSDVLKGDASPKGELPFIVGVLGDFSGQPEKPLPKLKNRDFIEIDMHNFDEKMAEIGPRVAFRVDDVLTEDPKKAGGESKNKVNVDMTIGSMGDLTPVGVVKKVPALAKLGELRQALYDLQTSIPQKGDLGDIMNELVSKPGLLKALASSTKPKPTTEG
jgi:type VI secretion system protein ImpB